MGIGSGPIPTIIDGKNILTKQILEFPFGGIDYSLEGVLFTQVKNEPVPKGAIDLESFAVFPAPALSEISGILQAIMKEYATQYHRTLTGKPLRIEQAVDKSTQPERAGVAFHQQVQT